MEPSQNITVNGKRSQTQANTTQELATHATACFASSCTPKHSSQSYRVIDTTKVTSSASGSRAEARTRSPSSSSRNLFRPDGAVSKYQWRTLPNSKHTSHTLATHASSPTSKRLSHAFIRHWIPSPPYITVADRSRAACGLTNSPNRNKLATQPTHTSFASFASCCTTTKFHPLT